MGEIIERDFGKSDRRPAKIRRRIEALPTLILRAPASSLGPHGSWFAEVSRYCCRSTRTD